MKVSVGQTYILIKYEEEYVILKRQTFVLEAHQRGWGGGRGEEKKYM